MIGCLPFVLKNLFRAGYESEDRRSQTPGEILFAPDPLARHNLQELRQLRAYLLIDLIARPITVDPQLHQWLHTYEILQAAELDGRTFISVSSGGTDNVPDTTKHSVIRPDHRTHPPLENFLVSGHTCNNFSEQRYDIPHTKTEVDCLICDFAPWSMGSDRRTDIHVIKQNLILIEPHQHVQAHDSLVSIMLPQIFSMSRQYRYIIDPNSDDVIRWIVKYGLDFVHFDQDHQMVGDPIMTVWITPEPDDTLLFRFSYEDPISTLQKFFPLCEAPSPEERELLELIIARDRQFDHLPQPLPVPPNRKPQEQKA